MVDGSLWNWNSILEVEVETIDKIIILLFSHTAQTREQSFGYMKGEWEWECQHRSSCIIVSYWRLDLWFSVCGVAFSCFLVQAGLPSSINFKVQMVMNTQSTDKMTPRLVKPMWTSRESRCHLYWRTPLGRGTGQ